MPELLTLESKLRALVAELKPLLERATPRPWVYQEYAGGSRIIVPPDIPINIFCNKANSELICAAVNALDDLEALLAERPRVCIGYPDCDGDLEGEPHSEKCPCAAQPFSGTESGSK